MLVTYDKHVCVLAPITDCNLHNYKIFKLNINFLITSVPNRPVTCCDIYCELSK